MNKEGTVLSLDHPDCQTFFFGAASNITFKFRVNDINDLKIKIVNAVPSINEKNAEEYTGRAAVESSFV